MEFKLKRKNSIIRLKKPGHIIERESTTYRCDEFPAFAICFVNEKADAGSLYNWGLQHVPSERVVLTIFKRKRDVEVFFDYFLKETDLNSLLLLTCIRNCI
jgi:hypothetical protein